jgi:hypothetical protein
MQIAAASGFAVSQGVARRLIALLSFAHRAWYADMTRIGTSSILTAVLLALAGSPALRAQTNAEPPDFKEVYDLIREHVSGMTEADLNRTAVTSLVSALGPGVSFSPDSGLGDTATSGPALARKSLLDDSIGYLRLRRLAPGAAESVRQSCEQWTATNHLKGVVLDLRYASGDDYAAAAAVADLFVKQERPLLDLGNKVLRSSEKLDPITLPVAVLVNGQTSGAAEALAGVMRQTGAALILGGKTAGKAMIAKEYPLKNGGHLRIAASPIQLGDGSAMPSQGMEPDIAVKVKPEDEKAWFADAFQPISQAGSVATVNLAATNTTNAGTNRSGRRVKLNEAELVRERREGLNPDADPLPVRAAEPEKPILRDPALARAVDLLKGLAVVRQARS